ncbi:MAG: glutamyl-tRNA reductase [Mariniblastus sp.]|nr:glutamyl-tRNA reductase [Mariniblastus sp.]
MILQLVGCSHHLSSVEVRERLAFDSQQAFRFLKKFYDAYPRSEIVLLSTCNRTELYAAGRSYDLVPTAEEMSLFLADFSGLPPAEMNRFLFEHANEQAVRHLFSVAASLDSMVIGEAQILSQVKLAYQQAAELNQPMPLTHQMFQSAIRVAKRVASETKIHTNRVSIPSIAVGVFTRQIFERLDNKQILVIGAGKMAAETLKYVRDEGGRDIVVVNRTLDAAVRLANQFNGRAGRWDDLAEHVRSADLIVSTTGASQPVVTMSMYQQIERDRQQRPLLILDLAIPRDFEPVIGDSLNVYLYTIDDLQQECQRNRDARAGEWPKAQKILDQETGQFMRELSLRSRGPTIQRLKQRAEEIKNAEVRRLMNRLEDVTPEQQKEIEAAFHRMINKLLHPPLASLKEEGEPDANGLLDALKRLFQLND